MNLNPISASSTSAVFWLRSLSFLACACGPWMGSARADFVDELPELTATPRTPPLPSGQGVGQSPRPGGGAGQGDALSTPDTDGSTRPDGASGGAGRPAGGATSTPAGQGAPGASTPGAPKAGAAGEPNGGLFGSDLTRHNAEAPISTKGDTLEGSMSRGKLTLTGNVEIQQADTTLKSDVAEVYSKAGTTTPERAIAKGRVSIKKTPSPNVPELRAVAEELEYFIPQRRMILKGRPKIWRGKELLQGEIIEVSLDTGEIKIRGARGVVDPRNAQQQGGKGAKGNKGEASSGGAGTRKVKTAPASQEQ